MRSTNLYGPEQIGLRPTEATSASANDLGDSIMPARSDSCASSVASGCLRVSTSVAASGASTFSTEASSPLRRLSGSVMARSRLALAAAASNLLPSWNSASSRSLKVSTLLSGLNDHEVASCGTKCSLGSMSTSLSHSEVKTMRPT
ncbi:Uncharacterised protein [Achromobacter xylosoxidans]|nr:Uncharacterised protein [Achromobacter xylosoxidans]CUI91881.1 Uncharacterised protein [Achromobacter xylosoxidans]CUJ08199.1 Uncharacterised protein [Achromobacter xylosoxidans]CUJ26568.1 Uncharacterised protein [Achromobacter xylosoxidans]CUJ31944.1 Uncharacterised protein [Achromobacter xylosoxidans]